MDKLLDILEEMTPLTLDKDLFAYEIPLSTAGVWVNDNQTGSRFNGVDYQDFNIYYRDKNKSAAITNIKLLKDTVDALRGSQGDCKLQDGTTFRLDMKFTWDFLDKDYEGYFVWANQLRLIV
jgi:hypothetical protein